MNLPRLLLILVGLIVTLLIDVNYAVAQAVYDTDNKRMYCSEQAHLNRTGFSVTDADVELSPDGQMAVYFSFAAFTCMNENGLKWEARSPWLPFSYVRRSADGSDYTISVESTDFRMSLSNPAGYKVVQNQEVPQDITTGRINLSADDFFTDEQREQLNQTGSVSIQLKLGLSGKHKIVTDNSTVQSRYGSAQMTRSLRVKKTNGRYSID